MSQPDPLVLIVSGPSGSGKSTLMEKILQLPKRPALCVVHDTGPPQDGEQQQVLQFRIGSRIPADGRPR